MNLGIPIVLLVFLLLPVILVAGGIVFLAILLARAGRSAGSGQSAEETRMIQEMYHQLGDLNKRVDALETILLDRTKKAEEPQR